jgi:hypothetical protein
MIKTNRAEYIRQAERAKRERLLAKARTSLLEFTKLTNPNFVAGWSHKIIAYYLEKYWKGEINLILSLPHGTVNPSLRAGICPRGVLVTILTLR